MALTDLRVLGSLAEYQPANHRGITHSKPNFSLQIESFFQSTSQQYFFFTMMEALAEYLDKKQRSLALPATKVQLAAPLAESFLTPAFP